MTSVGWCSRCILYTRTCTLAILNMEENVFLFLSNLIGKIPRVIYEWFYLAKC